MTDSKTLTDELIDGIIERAWEQAEGETQAGVEAAETEWKRFGRKCIFLATREQTTSTGGPTELHVESWKGNTAPGQYKPQQGTWELRAPDGTSWHEASPMECLRAEMNDRIPPAVALARIYEAIQDDGAAPVEQTASTGEPKPIATLHDDGYFTWAAGVRPPYLSSYAGWQMDVYAAGFTTEQLRTALAAPVEQAGSPKPEWSAYMQHPEWIANNRPKQAGSTPDETPDTARLNWLDAHSKESSIRFDDHTFKTVKAWAIAAHTSFAIRDAIDAAMKAD